MELTSILATGRESTGCGRCRSPCLIGQGEVHVIRIGPPAERERFPRQLVTRRNITQFDEMICKFLQRSTHPQHLSLSKISYFP